MKHGYTELIRPTRRLEEEGASVDQDLAVGRGKQLGKREEENIRMRGGDQEGENRRRSTGREEENIRMRGGGQEGENRRRTGGEEEKRKEERRRRGGRRGGEEQEEKRRKKGGERRAHPKPHPYRSP